MACFLYSTKYYKNIIDFDNLENFGKNILYNFYIICFSLFLA